MIKYHLKIAWRNISRHKLYTSINVLGLALGICACVSIYVIVSYEFSFDTFHPDGDRISDPAGAVGQILYNMNKPYPIVGVVADFMENSFHEAMKPVAITHMPEWEKSVAVKMLVRNNEAENAKVILAAMEGEWKKVFPDAPFDAALLNESIGWLYDQEKKTAWLVNMAMGITIFISCMGLFGLGMYTAQRRTKEIGIRKVLGAGVIQIAAMLSKDFLLLVGISFVLASPIAWYFMEQWLGDFAYRVSIGWYIFALSALAAMTITLMAISYQAIRAALANPVNSLRTE